METIILTILGSGAFFTFLQFLINRNDNKKTNEMKSLKADVCRLEMLIMMNHYPTETIELLKIAQKYFVQLNGDFYMTGMFAKFMREHDIPIPKWFNEND